MPGISSNFGINLLSLSLLLCIYEIITYFTLNCNPPNSSMTLVAGGGVGGIHVFGLSRPLYMCGSQRTTSGASPHFPPCLMWGLFFIAVFCLGSLARELPGSLQFPSPTFPLAGWDYRHVPPHPALCGFYRSRVQPSSLCGKQVNH